jgi:hypothetical protein
LRNADCGLLIADLVIADLVIDDLVVDDVDLNADWSQSAFSNPQSEMS